MPKLGFPTILVHILNILCYIGIDLWLVLGVRYLYRRFGKRQAGSGW
jgi:hypothetical protein